MKVKIFLSSQITGVSDLLHGLSSLFLGVGQNEKGKQHVKRGESYYTKAEGYIPDYGDPDLFKARDIIEKRRRSYTSGAEAMSISDILQTGLATGAYSAGNSGGGNVGQVLKGISLVQDVNAEKINKALVEQDAIANQLIGLEAQASSKITERKDAISQNYMDFNTMRGSQELSLGYGLKKSAAENMAAGAATAGEGIIDLSMALSKGKNK